MPFLQRRDKGGGDMDLKTRVRKRIPYDEVTDDVLEEYIVTVSDRLCLRLGTEKLPDLFGSSALRKP